MADWVTVTARGSDAQMFVNLDNVALMAASNGGTVFTLPNGETISVNEATHQLIVAIPVRRHA